MKEPTFSLEFPDALAVAAHKEIQFQTEMYRMALINWDTASQ